MTDRYPLAVLNAAVVSDDGTYEVTTIPPHRAIDMVAMATATGQEVTSFVGHPATAAILTEILGVEILATGRALAQQPGQVALVFKLNARPAGGVELTRKQLEEIGFTFKVLRRIY